MQHKAILSKAMLVILFMLGIIGFQSCDKEIAPGNEAGFGTAPRKEVPGPFVGQFTYVTTTGGYMDQYGHYTDAVSQGVTYHINQNGTGTAAYLSRITNYSGSQVTDEIRMNCTYEITALSDHIANIIIHYVSGKNYHNGVIKSELTAAQLYPNGDAVYNDVEYGTNSQGKTFFIVGSGNNTAQFTQQ